MSKIVVCDFDGTITTVDLINKFLTEFADKKWLEIEKGWIAGTVSTVDAMRKQFGLIKNMTEEKFNKFFDEAQIDLSFVDFYNLAKKNNIKVVILSDGFEYFIERTLEKFGINDIEIYSNHFEYNNGEFIIEFPNHSDTCKRKSGTCKCSFVKKFKELYDTVYYIGDGVSDYCVADKVDFLFAKNRLLEYCTVKNIPYTRYNNFNDVIKDVRLGLNNQN